MCPKTWHKSILKEKEINDELKKINEQIEECKIIESTNKNISNQLKIVEKMLDTPNTIKDFNKDIFENLVENIIVGEVDENGNTNSKVIRFISKIGTDYRYEINEDKSVSFRPNNVAIKSFWLLQIKLFWYRNCVCVDYIIRRKK